MGKRRHGFSPLYMEETDVLLFTPENGMTAEILSRTRELCLRDQASDNTNCHDNRYPYSVALQPQYGVSSGPGKSQRPTPEQRSQQNSMDHTRKGLRGQAWKQPLFSKPAWVMWSCSSAREAACPRGRGYGFGEQVAVAVTHSLEVVKSNSPKEVTFQRRPGKR